MITQMLFKNLYIFICEKKTHLKCTQSKIYLTQRDYKCQVQYRLCTYLTLFFCFLITSLIRL